MSVPTSAETLDAPSPQNTQWQTQFLHNFTAGIDTSVKSEDVEDLQLVNAKNVRSIRNRVALDFGFKDFGDAVVGDPRVVWEHFEKDGSSFLTLITNTTFYVWAQSVTQWQYVSNGTSTTLSATANATDTSITVADITGFADGERIGIMLDNGNQHQTTVNGTPAGSTINIDDAIPSTATSGKAVVEAASFSGSATKPVSVVAWPAADEMYFTNGVDTPQIYNGTTVQAMTGLPSSPFTCQTLAVWNNMMFALHTTEGGTAHPQRVRNCDTGDPSDWTTGVAGFTDLYDTEDHIQHGAVLGTDLYIYKERNIIRGQYVGTTDVLINWTTAVDGEGALSPESVVNLGDLHLVVGQSSVYEFRGRQDVRSISEAVYYKLFGYAGELSPSFRAMVFAFYVEELDEMWIFYPSGGDQYCDKMLRYSLGNGSWFPREYDVDILGYGFYSTQSARTWNDLVGSWSSQDWIWDSQNVASNSPTTLLCRRSPAQVAEYDYITNQDDGTDIEGQIETGDFYLPHQDARFDKFEMVALGEVTLHYSTDEGASWIAIGTKTAATMGKLTFWRQFVARKVRFRISATGEFGLEWFSFVWRPETEDQ